GLRAQSAGLEVEQAVELGRYVERVLDDVPVVEALGRCLGDQGIALFAGAQRRFGAAHVGDVGAGQQQAAAGERSVARGEQPAVPFALALALAAGGEFGEFGGDQNGGISRSVVAAKGREPQQRRKLRTRPAQLRRKVEQRRERPVAVDKHEVAIEQRDAFAQRIETDAQQRFPPGRPGRLLDVVENRHPAPCEPGEADLKPLSRSLTIQSGPLQAPVSQVRRASAAVISDAMAIICNSAPAAWEYSHWRRSVSLFSRITVQMAAPTLSG